MLVGIELILKRMETHPEEFVGVNGGCSKEWHAVITPAVPYLTSEEREALNSALTKAYRDHLNAQVMRTIAGEEIMTDREKMYAEDYYGRSLPELLRKSQEEIIASTLGAGVSLKTSTHLKGLMPAIAGSSVTQPSAFGAVPVGAEGQTVAYSYKWESIK